MTFVGSEKVKASRSKGFQLVETNNINRSLLTLGNEVILFVHVDTLFSPQARASRR